MQSRLAAQWAAIGPHLDALLTLAPEQRERALDELAAAEPEAATRLRSLLASRDAASSADFLGGAADPSAVSASVTAGQVLGSWTLVDIIGEGGMGSVWRARRSDGRFEGEAAIKLLRTGLFDAAAQERFRREGAILARLRHPGIAQLLDAGVSERGQPYLVLELVRGEPIDDWFRARRVGVRQGVEIFLQVLDAVSAAHAQLVIHRDLKPPNILVDDSGRVRLLDFGIARLQDDDHPAVTREGALALTPRYAAPEQLNHEPLSVATDIHALGTVLYELLTGVHPSGLPANSPAIEYLKAAAGGAMPLASERAPQRRHELRGDLDTILGKALATRPEERYVTTAALRDDLQRHLRHEPIAARNAGLLYRASKLLRRRPLESAVVAGIAVAVPAGAHLQAAVLLSMAVGTSVALWQARRARQQAEMARAGQQRADAVKTFIASAFRQAVPRNGAGGVVTAGDLLHAAVPRIRQELKTQPLAAAELMAIVGDSFMELGDVPSGRQVLPGAVVMCERAFGRRHPITLKARCSLLQAYNVMGELEASEAMQTPLICDLRSAMPAAARQLVAALRSRSFTLTKRGAEAAAVQALEEAWAIGRSHLGDADRDTLTAAGLLVNTLGTFERADDALKVSEQALEVARAAFGCHRPDSLLASLESWHADTLASLGLLPEAVALLRQALRDQVALDGMDTNRNRHTKSTLARVLAEHGEVDEAIVLMQEAVASDARLVPGPSVDKGTMLSQLGWMLTEVGRIDEGLAAMQRAVDVMRAAGGGQVKGDLTRLGYRAHAWLRAGRAREALEMAETLLARQNAASSTARAIAARVRVGALRCLDRVAEADAALAAMLEFAHARGVTGVNHGRAAIEAAALRLAQGRHDEAAGFARRAVSALASVQSPGSPLMRQALEMARCCVEPVRPQAHERPCVETSPID